MNNHISVLDFILILLYIPIILGIGYAFSKKLPYKVLRGYFMKGLALKLLCGLGFAWVYVYYYGGGDTQMYFRGGSAIFNAVFSPNGGLGKIFDDSVLSYGSDATILTQRITGIVNLFSFNSFWACTLLFSALSFIGLWLLFMCFFRLFPKLHKPLALVTLFIPGVVFWSSGIMKDSLCMLFIGIIVYAVQNIFLFNRKKITSVLLLGAGFYVIINLKAYIALALLVSLALYALLALKANIKNATTRILIMPIAAVIIFGAAIFTMNRIGESLERYSLENLAETAQTYQGYHLRTSVGGRGGSEVRTGSGYSLGEINYNSPASLAAKIPLAINVTFFRPYIWEVRNPVMLLSALESLLIFLFTIKVIFKTGLGRFFRQLVTNKEVLFCISFALIFGFAVGFTSYNFGSLVRYKAPCIPFFLIAMVLINDLPAKKKIVQARRQVRRPAIPRPTQPQPS
jgi:hypothetical protein